MLAKRLPLLWVFAGGCVTGAVVIGYWREVAAPSPTTTSALHSPALLPEADAAPEPTAEARSETARAVARDRDAPRVEPAAREATHDDAGEPAAEQGSSVADVLARLEGAYRQELAAAPPPAAATVTEAPSPALGAAPVPATAPALARAEPAVAPAPAAAPAPPRAETAALAATALAPAVAPVLARAEPPLAPAPAPVTAAVVPQNIHIGDVQQNTYTGTVIQGDVYLQQLALLQYMQLLALSPYGLAAPLRAPREGAARRAPVFSSTLTNPDNPWGFKFPPTVLAK